jgi:phosphoribosylaminoimidazole carboxylase PurK protein
MKYDLGYLGGGQLARMGALAAHAMGLRTCVLDPDPKCCAGQVTDAIVGALDDPTAIAKLLQACEYVTLENEFIPHAAVRKALNTATIPAQQLVPGPDTLQIVQDKWLQRSRYQVEGLPGPLSWLVHRPEDIRVPCVLKSRFGGYDGKGVRLIRSESDALTVPSEIFSGTWYAEEFVPFHQEVAVMVIATRGGAMSAYPPVVTHQPNSVCEFTWSYESPYAAEAIETALRAVRALGGAGLFGVELFEVESGCESRFQINEVAPRPHNTGHYTMDSDVLSQFEAQIRLTLGMSLPEVRAAQPWSMVNLLGPSDRTGDLQSATQSLFSIAPAARLHWYGKSMRAGRKVGHINIPATNDLVFLGQVRDAFWEGFLG